MSICYRFEPSRLEVWLTSCVGHTLLKKYYARFVESLDIRESDRVLDFGCGSGILTKKMARELKSGRLTFIDVSKTWLKVAKRRLRTCNNTEGFQICDFSGQIGDGEFDKIIVHFTLHDFPKDYLEPIIRQLIDHLHPLGRLIIREPIEKKHGLPLYEIHKVLDNTRGVTLKYALHCHEIMGDYADIVCMFRSKHYKSSVIGIENSMENQKGETK